MGLFDGKAKKQETENRVTQSLAQLPLLDNVITTITEKQEEEAWLTMGQSYYDDCERIVTIEPDALVLRWVIVEKKEVVGNNGQRQVQNVSDVVKEIGYSYTKSGYVPLHGHRNEKGNEDVSTKRVCYLWASIVRERLAAKFKDCKFMDVQEGIGDNVSASFRYKVPALTFKDWF